MSDTKPFTDDVRAVIQGFVLMLRVDKAWQFSFDFSRRGYATAIAAVFMATLLLALLAWVVGAETVPTNLGVGMITALLAKYLVTRIYLETTQKMTLFMPTFILMVWHSALAYGLGFDVFALLAIVNAVGLPDTVSLFLIVLCFFPLALLLIILQLRIFRLGAGTTGMGALGLFVALLLTDLLIASAVSPLLGIDAPTQSMGLAQFLGIDPNVLRGVAQP